ncbi:hypothetical protein Tco_1509255 [Tanacetum coccineum]
MGTICFENDHVAAITRYRDYMHGNVMICHVYYVEGLRHNLFSVGDDLLTGARDSNLYTISISDMAASSPFDELTAMASEHSCLEPESNRFNVEDSSAESNQTPSKEDLDDLFGPLYEEYYKARKP